MTDETVTVELEVTEQQLDDAKRFINKGELILRERGYSQERVFALTNVWCQLHRSGTAAFGEDSSDTDDADGSAFDDAYPPRPTGGEDA